MAPNQRSLPNLIDHPAPAKRSDRTPSTSAAALDGERPSCVTRAAGSYTHIQTNATHTNTYTHKNTPQTNNTIKIVQVNLHHCREAMTEFCRHVVEENIDLALLQEPHVVKGRVAGLSSLGGDIIYHENGESNPRACIFASSRVRSLGLIKADCYSDLASATITIQLNTGARTRVLLVSAYLPSEENHKPPSPELEEITRIYHGKNIPIVAGCDANAHHTVWGSTNCNKKGDLLLDFLSSTGYDVLNVGNTPTFVTKNRREVLDITIATEGISQHITCWKVDTRDSKSDHRRITFNLGAGFERTFTRNARKTDWMIFEQQMELWTPIVQNSLKDAIDIEREANRLDESLRKAYHKACPLREIKPGKGQPWWTKALEKLRKKTRRALRTALAKKDEDSWLAYKTERNSFKKECRRVCRNSWKAFCEGVENYPEAARLAKMLPKTGTCKLGSIRKEGNLITEPEKILEIMMESHFPESELCTGADMNNTSNYDNVTPLHTSDKTTITKEHLTWSVGSFQPYKSAGPDQIFPGMLQKALKFIGDDLLELYNCSIRLGYIPRKWREVRAVFIPKPGKASYQEAKAFRCISLSSFILKTLEKILDRIMREKIGASGSPIHQNQHAYMEGKSIETALHNLVNRIQRSMDHKEYALGCFFDVEGAFDRATPTSIEETLNREGINSDISGWIKTMLNHRLIQAELAGTTRTVIARRGFPQGGCLSPLLWCLLIDELVKKINSMNIYTQVYSDDGVLLVTGKVLSVMCNIMNRGLKTALEWSRGKGLNLNPDKTKLVLFTNKRKLGEAEPVTLEDQDLETVKEVRYLGVTLDSKLAFKTHIRSSCSKAKMAMMQCKRAIGKSWGMKPAIVLWIYKAIVLPRILHGAIAWWHKASLASNKKELDKVQRLAALLTTGAMRTTPTAALEILLGLNPLDLEAKKRAALQWFKLRSTGLWTANHFDDGHAKINREYEDKLSMILSNNDLIKKERNFDKRYRIHIGQREDWKINSDGTIGYTDGSRKESTKLSGSGVHIICEDGTEINSTISLGKYASVFQAEVFAIMECTEMVKHLDTGKITIYSDSQAALKALDKTETTSALVKECKQAVNKLANNHDVTLAWVPGHHGNTGNEAADELARQGADTDQSGPEPRLPIAQKITTGVIGRSIAAQTNQRWRSLTVMRQSKVFIKSLDKKRTSQLIKLSRKTMRLVIEVITGHCRLNRHLTLIGTKTDPRCPECMEAEETSIHLLAECPMYSRVRWEIMGKDKLEPDDLEALKVEQIARFCKETGRFDEVP